jgi:hypothetical protein
VFRRALFGLLSVTAAGTLASALASPAMAAPPATHCDPPGLHTAIGNATDKQTVDQALLDAANKAVTDAEAALTAAQLTGDPAQIATAQAAMDAAKAAATAAATQVANAANLVTHLTDVLGSIILHKNCAPQPV